MGAPEREGEVAPNRLALASPATIGRGAHQPQPTAQHPLARRHRKTAQQRITLRPGRHALDRVHGAASVAQDRLGHL